MKIKAATNIKIDEIKCKTKKTKKHRAKQTEKTTLNKKTKQQTTLKNHVRKTTKKRETE